MSKTTIDLTPTWRASMVALVRVLIIGDVEGQTIAREELLRIGDWLDVFNTMDWETILDAAAASDDEQAQAAVAAVREWFARDEDSQ